MSTQGNNLVKEIEKMRDDARVTRRAHFLAAQRKLWIQRALSVGIIVLNLAIGSTLLDKAFPQQADLFIRVIALIAAAFAGIQTAFNFSKDVESHHSAGERYAAVQRRIDILLAEQHDGLLAPDEVAKRFESLTDEYLGINKELKGHVPSNRDFDKVREKLAADTAAGAPRS